MEYLIEGRAFFTGDCRVHGLRRLLQCRSLTTTGRLCAVSPWSSPIRVNEVGTPIIWQFYRF